MGGEIVRDLLRRTQGAYGLIFRSRPKSLSDVTAQDHTINVLQRTLQASNV